MAPRILALGPASVALTFDDRAAADWLAEVMAPCFAPAEGPAEWTFRLSSRKEAHAAVAAGRPPDAAPRVCFAHDTRTMSLPAWAEGSGGIALADDERHCFLVVGPRRVDLAGDPASRRWRFTSMCVMQEIAATRLRRTELDVHAAAVEAAGRAVLIVGRKGAGKTTVSLHLLRSGRCRAIANDRVFAGTAGGRSHVRGIPTAVKLHPPTIAQFPELLRGLPRVERPYLHSLAELAQASAAQASTVHVGDTGELALSPAQLVRQMNTEARDVAPLGAVVFPQIRADIESWSVERLTPSEVGAEIWANLYGSACGLRAPTLFEELTGGLSVPSRDLADAIAASVIGYRVALGPRAYDDSAFAARLLESVLG